MISKIRKKLTGLTAEEGFTLIELMIVIAIIGILAAIALPKFGSVKDTAKRVRAESEMKSIQTALEMYYAQYGHYPEENNLETVEGISETVIDGYDSNDVAGYDRENKEEYSWTYSTENYTITIKSDGTFTSTVDQGGE